jgi:hypothetical protein
VGALLLAIGLQLLTVRALEDTFHWVEAQVLALIDPQHRQVDPLRSETRIGSVVRLKGSERIELRVQVPPDWRTPLLMTEAVYDRYRFGTWSVAEAPFQTIDRPAIDAPWWFSGEPAEAGDALEVLDFMPAETAALAVPLQAGAISSRTLLGLAGNPLGTLQGDGRRGYQRYRVLPGTRTLAAPTAEDRNLPGFIADALTARAESLGIDGLPADEAVARLQAHFRQHRLDPGHILGVVQFPERPPPRLHLDAQDRHPVLQEPQLLQPLQRPAQRQTVLREGCRIATEQVARELVDQQDQRGPGHRLAMDARQRAAQRRAEARQSFDPRAVQRQYPQACAFSYAPPRIRGNLHQPAGLNRCRQ